MLPGGGCSRGTELHFLRLLSQSASIFQPNAGGGVRRLRCEAYIYTGDEQEARELYGELWYRSAEIEKRFKGTEPLK